jgi:hypothetical protein
VPGNLKGEVSGREKYLRRSRDALCPSLWKLTSFGQNIPVPSDPVLVREKP